MVNPATPIERKRRLGNPGHRPMPDRSASVALEPIPRDSFRRLGEAGKNLWQQVSQAGGLWISAQSDIELLQLVCEQLDRRETIRNLLAEDPSDRSLNMTVNEIEKLIASNLGLLGFTPSDRSRLGFAEVRNHTELDELKKMKREMIAKVG